MGAKPSFLTPPDDLRLRLVGALFAIACISQLRLLSLALPVAALALLAVWRRPRPGRRLPHVEVFLVLLFVTLPFTVPGVALFTLGPLTASVEGVGRAALVACKVLACMSVLTILLGDVEPSRLGPALRSLHVPDRLIRLLLMTARYVGLIRDEARRLADAMRMRGFRPRSNRHTWRSYGHFIGMLLVRALDRAGRIEEAMRCRGSSGRFPYRDLPAPTSRDWAGFAVILAAGLLAMTVDRL